MCRIYFLLFFIILFYSCVSTSKISQRIQHEEIALPIKDGTLHGTLSIAKGKGTPVVLIIAGSGGVDRNGGKGLMYKMLADSLLASGISVLRYDKRNSGETYKSLVTFGNTNFDSFVDDAKICLEFLKRDKRFSEITVVGHSQGSLVGMLAAHSGKVDRFVSLAGAGERIDLILRDQIYDPPIVKTFFGPLIDSIFVRLERGERTPVDSIPGQFKQLFDESKQSFMASWMNYDPCDEIAQLEIPSLIVQGEMDYQVRMDQYERLIECNSDASHIVVSNMNHAMKYMDTMDKMKNIENYDDPESEILSECVHSIVEFVLK